MFHLRSASRVVRLRRRAAFSLAGLTGVALIAVSVSYASAAGSVSLKPVADTWVSATNPGTNYGVGPTLRIDGSPVWSAFIRFDLGPKPGTITSAILSVHPNSSSAAGFSVRRVASATWSETSTTAANAPALGGVAVKSGPLSTGAALKINVTSLVAGSGLVSLGLTTTDGTAISLASRESAYPPSLTITTSAPTPVPTATPTPVPTAAPTAVPTATPTALPTATPTAVPTATPTPISTPTPPATPIATAPPTVAPSPTPTAGGPVRAAFYYPWFPEAWDQSGVNPFTHYNPTAGFYDGASTSVIAGQIRAMQYGKIGVGIASWWGQGSQTDSKMPVLLSTAAGTGFKWAFYYELEGTTDPSAAKIASDLAYINGHYGADPSLYRVNGRPVVFVYAGPSDACGMANRWAQANASKTAYVVLKVFPGYDSCANQPDQWHQYAPAVGEDHQAGHSFTISPGFWLATGPVRLTRDLTRWQQEVHDMVASGEPWQLVTTFNEWGEGTSVESASQWASSSGYGAYLDALHNI